MNKPKKRSGNPQPDDGCARIAHELMEALARADLSGREFSILYVVLDKTYGWQKKEDWIAIPLISQITGIAPSGCSRAVSSLTRKRILLRRLVGRKLYLGLNKHHLDWMGGRPPLPVEQTKWPRRPLSKTTGETLSKTTGATLSKTTGNIRESTEALGTEVVITAPDFMNLPPTVRERLEEHLGPNPWNQTILRVLLGLLEIHGESHLLRAIDEAAIHMIPANGFIPYVKSVLTKQAASGYTWESRTGDNQTKARGAPRPSDPVLAWAEQIPLWRELNSLSSREAREDWMRWRIKKELPELKIDVSGMTPAQFFIRVYQHLGRDIPVPIPADA